LSKRFTIRATIRSKDEDAIRPVLYDLFAASDVKKDANGRGLIIEAEIEGVSAKEANRALLSALRKKEKSTTLRSELTLGNNTYKFLDYALKNKVKA